MNEERNDLQKMITQALEEIKEAEGEKFDLDNINLALVSRKTGLSRSRLRRIKANGFMVPEHGLKGKASDLGVLSGYTGLIDDLLRKGITNSVVSFDRLREAGYGGSLSTIKRYIAKHKDYEITLFYIFVDNYNVCLERIKNRVLKGGHNVPIEDVKRRYYRSIKNFKKYINKIDNWNLYYNTNEFPLLIAKSTKQDLVILNNKIYKLFMEIINE